MRVPQWRRHEFNSCIQELLPTLLQWIARKLGCELQEWQIQPPTRSQLCGFHFSNVVNVTAQFSTFSLTFKLPIPNEDDLYVVEDTFRVLTNELTDQLVSPRSIGHHLIIRWQGSTVACVSDEFGRIKLKNELVPLWTLFYWAFTEEELKQRGLLWELTDKQETYSLGFKRSKLYLKIGQPLDTLHPLQRIVAHSLSMHARPAAVNVDLRSAATLSPEVVEFIEEILLDPITRVIYKLEDAQSLIRYTCDQLLKFKEGDLVSSNLAFKRVRSYENVMIVLYEKLAELAAQAKHQKVPRLASDFLLKRMFVDIRLQRFFEYYDVSSMFKELSMKYKILMPVEFAPYDMRDVHPTMLGSICCYDTPDDQGIGTRLQLAFDCELGPWGFFVGHKKDGSILSVALSCVPFNAHDDGNRLQMGANFLRQALTPVRPEIPYVSTHYLAEATKQSLYYKRASRSGSVIYRDKEVIAIKDDTDHIFLCRVPNALWSPTTKDTIEPQSSIMSHYSIKFHRHCPGVNLDVVFVPAFGWNYEDAVVVTEKGASKLATKQVIEYELTLRPDEVLLVCPQENKFYRKGDVLFKWIPSPKNPVNILCAGADESKIIADYDLVVDRIYTYFRDERVLSHHKSSSQVLSWIVAHNRPRHLKKVLPPHIAKYIPLYYPEQYELVGRPNCIHIKVQAVVTRSFKVGDKVGNRHGNKGVCSRIVPNELFTSEDGFVPDIVLNPLGVVSRMNVGQILEMHLGEVIKVVSRKVESLVSRRKYNEAISLLKILERGTGGAIPYIHIQDLSPEEQLQELLQNGITLELPLYTKNSHIMVERVCKLFDVPLTRRWKFPRTSLECGYGSIYTIPLVHTVDAKFSVRSVGPYHSRTLLPVEDESTPSGQRVGEMEIWNLLAYGALENCIEVLGPKADDILSKESLIALALKSGSLPSQPESVQSNQMLYHFLYALGLPFGTEKVMSQESLQQYYKELLLAE